MFEKTLFVQKAAKIPGEDGFGLFYKLVSFNQNKVSFGVFYFTFFFSHTLQTHKCRDYKHLIQPFLPQDFLTVYSLCHRNVCFFRKAGLL